MLNRSSRNKTLQLSNEDRIRLRNQLATLQNGVLEGIVHGDFKQQLQFLPKKCVDLLFLDPPYNLSKKFNTQKFSKIDKKEYSNWLNSVLLSLLPYLKQTATVYICGDWFSSYSIFDVASEHLFVRNRITWEREKGRGAKNKWKNNSEDIWFCTVSDEYYFNVDAVKLRRKVLAPYTNNGDPKDWEITKDGNFRDTYPSNLWTDISIPFWSMSENTEHPTQKSEKLLAKLILASSKENDLIFDPFLGSGTSCVVSKKLGRKYLGIELDEEFCLLALRRLEMADTDKTIQGYTDNVFWERNSGK